MRESMGSTMALLLAACLVSGQERVEDADNRLQDCLDRGTGLLMAAQHAGAAEAFKEAAALDADNADLAYRAARCYGRAGKKKEAFEQLHAAVARGFLDVARMNAEADLASLAGDRRYQAVLAAAHAKLSAIERERERAARMRMLDALADAQARFEFNFDLNGLFGGQVSLAALRGRVVIASIMGTWAPACKNEAKTLNDVAEKYAEDAPAIVGLFLEHTSPEDAVGAAAAFVTETKFFHPCAMIDETVVAQLPEFRLMPVLLFFDKEGNVRHMHAGTTSPAMFTGWLDALLGKGAKGTAAPPNANVPKKVVVPNVVPENTAPKNVIPPSSAELLRNQK